MFYSRDGLPDEGENVICTVTKIHFHSVFASLNDYKNKSGLLHISEISPGRVRNIREYVKEGKVIVCKVLKIDNQRGHIDLSLRRVSDAQRIKKMSLMKQEQKAEKIIENTATELKIEVKKLYDKIAKIAFANYDYIYDLFFDVILGEFNIKDLKLTDKETETLLLLIQQRIKKSLVELGGTLKVISYDGDGVEQIKALLVKVDNVDERLIIRYLGGGLFGLSITCEEFKDAENIIKNAIQLIDTNCDGKHMTYEWNRNEGKKVEE